MSSNVTIHVYSPPVFLPLFRDLFITAWNFVVAESDGITINEINLKDNLEVLKINFDMSSFNFIQSNLSTRKTKINSLNDFEKEMNAELKMDFKNKKIIFQGGASKKIFFNLDMSKRFRNNIVKPFLYSFFRSYFNYNNRFFQYDIKKSQLKPVAGLLHIQLSFIYGYFIYKFGYNNSKINIGGKESFLVTTDPILDKSLASEFMGKDLKNIKRIVTKTLFKIKGEKGGYPILPEFISTRIILDVLLNFFRSSMIYSFNWPTLRLYLNTGIENNYSIIEISPSLIHTSILALSSSSGYLGMKETELIKAILSFIDEGITEDNKYVNDIYSFINSVFQGNPSIDLFYKIRRIKIAQKLSA